MENRAQFEARTEFKFASGDGAAAREFVGHGAVFNNIDSYGDVIAPGAFKAWLADVKAGKQEWPAMLLQHGGMGLNAEDLVPIGSWTELGEDSRGLTVVGKLAATPRADEIYALMKMSPPAINGMSIGYIPKEWEPRSKPTDPKRKLKRIDVMEISVVTFPANRQARVTGVKAFGARPQNVRDLEAALHQACGLSPREAKRVASAGWAALMRNEDHSVELEQLAERVRRNIALARQPIY